MEVVAAIEVGNPLIETVMAAIDKVDDGNSGGYQGGWRGGDSEGSYRGDMGAAYGSGTRGESSYRGTDGEGVLGRTWQWGDAFYILRCY